MALNLRLLISAICLLLITPAIYGQDTVVYRNSDENIFVGRHVAILEDKNNTLSLDQVLKSDQFKKSDNEVPNLQITKSAFWVRMVIKNESDAPNLAVNLEYATIDSVAFFSVLPSGAITKIQTGEFIPFYKRKYKHQDYIFDLNLPPGETRTYYFKVTASEWMQLPIAVGTVIHISEGIYTQDLLFGIYAGIMMVMIFYNLFLFFTVRDRSYLYYVGYMLFVGGTQACLQGYTARFFYPESFQLANAMLIWVPALSGIFAVLFTTNFLSAKTYTPILYKILLVFLMLYVAIIVNSVIGNVWYSTIGMQMVVALLAVVVYTTAVRISLKGYRPAKIYLLAYTIFIGAVVVFVLRNAGVAPYNKFTLYAMEIGSSLEVIVLSLALADKINIFRKEKEASQEEALQALKENERIVREQNVILENKVNERTYELKVSNEELNKAMTELKDAEAQLVESEKMASLGQLTAGIAHEINNPINFVTSNVKPLNRDVHILLDAVEEMEKLALADADVAHKQKKIQEFKTDIDYDYLKLEIGQLLNGIGEGASRTAEIVKGLRIFSRLDEDDLKRADINENMEATLIIANNLLGTVVKVKKNFGKLPLVECYPGKLNQVFLNIISNAVYAIKKKYGEKEGGEITLTTTGDENYVYISMHDNGTGMDDNTKKRLFEPFFTTKDVGEGTGLGMSIAYNTINKHNGQILINSELGKGTEFILKLPLIHK